MMFVFKDVIMFLLVFVFFVNDNEFFFFLKGYNDMFVCINYWIFIFYGCVFYKCDIKFYIFSGVINFDKFFNFFFYEVVVWFKCMFWYVVCKIEKRDGWKKWLMENML